MTAALQQIRPAEARQMVEDGAAVLVDVREDSERQVEWLPGAIDRPLSRLAQGAPIDLPADKAAVFLCASGARTQRNAVALAKLAGGSGYALAGGLVAWKQAGFPVESA